MNSPKKNICTICHKLKDLKPYADKDSLLCQDCIALAEKLREDEAMMQRMLNLVAQETAGQPLAEMEPELPEVLDGVRYRTVDREQNKWYISVSELDRNPVEIFASTAFENDQHLQSRISNLTTITRLISLILRNIFMKESLTLEKVLNQLNRSSRQPNDLPEMLSRILANYQKNERRLKAKESIIP